MKENRKSMNSAVVGIDVGEEKSEACYLSPVGDTPDKFSSQMTDIRWSEFALKIRRETRNGIPSIWIGVLSIKKAGGTWVF
ncbi:MAG: hypothetical protein QW292_10940 [Candidatus Parvarchaeota archaeon]